MSPLVSIIIPCRNGAATLADAIKSCLDQTWDNLEVIVVDNGSCDDSIQVAQRYPSVTLLECSRKGASAARNAGLESARGEFIQFLDADDILDRHKIRAQMKRLSAGPRSSIASGGWGRFRHSPSEAVLSAEPVWRDLAPEEFLASSWLGGGMMPNFAWLTPRATIEKAGPWNERLSVNDDGEFFCRVALASSHILFCGDALGYYRSRDEMTLSKRRDRDALVSAFEAIELSCDRLLEHRNPVAARACAAHYQRFAYDAYPEAPDLVRKAERRVSQLGGSDLVVQGGRAFKIVSACLGWKVARRFQLSQRKLRAPKAPMSA
jgi:glycosyltransferase involved in cell wall biosynthesis